VSNPATPASPVRADVIILGAGMAGASLAAELAPHRAVQIVEREDQPGRHATGRSAAMFFESYGNATVRALTRASRAFLAQPPAGFVDGPLITPRSALIVAGADQQDRLDAMLQAQDAAPCLRRIDAAQACALVPILRPERIAAALQDDSGQDIDVAALHQAFLRQARRAGAGLALDAGEIVIERGGPGWRVHTRVGRFEAALLVNATGAWADEVARRAGAPGVGLQPYRRTVVMLPGPAGLGLPGPAGPGLPGSPAAATVPWQDWPMVIDADETLYFKPDAGQLLLSPANEDPMAPCDVAPEELDVALAIDRFERLTTLPVTRLNRRWAGLRSFVADRSPVVGFDPRCPGLFWLAGQGGYGIQMAPALARTAASLLLAGTLPDDIAAAGVTARALAPDRF